jgi:hypothetical protein
MQDFFGALTPPYRVKLCEADASSKECNADGSGLTATGRGGILLPLTLHVTGMIVSKQNTSADGWVFDASVAAKVDRISPLCGTVSGKIATRDNGTAYLLISNFYCNWMLIGNVLVNANLSIDSLDVKEKVVTGYYKLSFHGTGNAAGSGYYKAIVLPDIGSTRTSTKETP